jgi:hypothetical protein
MGTSIDMIEQHYGHLLAPHATKSRDILDAVWDGLDANWTQTANRRTVPAQSRALILAQRSVKRRKPSNGLEPLTPSLPWKCSTN